MKFYIDISNFVATRTHTGIQRVLREFLHRLLHQNHNLDYEIIYYHEDYKKFILLTSKELSLFLEDTKNHLFNQNLDSITFDEIKKDDIFFDMDGVWNNSLKRTFLYKLLHKNGVKIVNFIYDLVPVILPQYSHANTVRNFVTFLHAVYQYSDLVFFDSRSAEKDFLSIKTDIHNQRDISTRVVKLGSDIFQQAVSINKEYTPLLEKKYILFIGTLEPRKNQMLMLNVFEKLVKKYPELNLIFVGKEGWNNDALVKRINEHTLLNHSLFWLQNVDDTTLMALYKNAFLCVYISAYEGFGLPIAESLAYGNITITSKNSSMYEVGKNFADYLIYNSDNELYETIETYITDSKLYACKKQYIKENYIPYNWDLTFTSLVTVFENLQALAHITTPEKLQFVFISIHPENLEGTLNAIDKYISFVSEYIIITRADLIESFKQLPSKHPLIVIDEKHILKTHQKDFHTKDHQSKNWLLRASLLHLDRLDEQFIMLDDDNRPLCDIPMTHFIENGRYNAYYFYDLLEWHNRDSEYDMGQLHTEKILDVDGYELLSYSSHKPQIIDKKLFQNTIKYYFQKGLEKPIDEWSTYFNYNVSLYPTLFNKKKFDTLNWPANPSDWTWMYMPDTYHFENYYDASYKDGLFHSLNTDTLEEKCTLKQKQIVPYQNNAKLMQTNTSYYQALNLVHGVLHFPLSNSSACLCYGLPYYIEATQGSWIKIPLNYKVYGVKKQKLQLVYWIKEQEGARTVLPLFNESFDDNIIHFAISCTALRKKKYTLLIDLFVDDKPIYGLSTPYMLELLVK